MLLYQNRMQRVQPFSDLLLFARSLVLWQHEVRWLYGPIFTACILGFPSDIYSLLWLGLHACAMMHASPWLVMLNLLVLLKPCLTQEPAKTFLNLLSCISDSLVTSAMNTDSCTRHVAV